MKELQNPVMVIVGIVLLCLSATILTGTQEKVYEGLLGEWDVQTEDGQYTFVFVFSMEGDTLKGLFKGTSGDYEMEDLSFEDNELSFTVDIDAGGQTMSIDYNATIKGDTLEGFLSMEYGEANVTGKKRK
jgi:hypothetical protein